MSINVVMHAICAIVGYLIALTLAPSPKRVVPLRVKQQGEEKMKIWLKCNWVFGLLLFAGFAMLGLLETIAAVKGVAPYFYVGVAAFCIAAGFVGRLLSNRLLTGTFNVLK